MVTCKSKFIAYRCAFTHGHHRPRTDWPRRPGCSGGACRTCCSRRANFPLWACRTRCSYWTCHSGRACWTRWADFSLRSSGSRCTDFPLWACLSGCSRWTRRADFSLWPGRSRRARCTNFSVARSPQLGRSPPVLQWLPLHRFPLVGLPLRLLPLDPSGRFLPVARSLPSGPLHQLLAARSPQLDRSPPVLQWLPSGRFLLVGLPLRSLPSGRFLPVGLPLRSLPSGPLHQLLLVAQSPQLDRSPPVLQWLPLDPLGRFLPVGRSPQLDRSPPVLQWLPSGRFLLVGLPLRSLPSDPLHQLLSCGPVAPVGPISPCAPVAPVGPISPLWACLSGCSRRARWADFSLWAYLSGRSRWTRWTDFSLWAGLSYFSFFANR